MNKPVFIKAINQATLLQNCYTDKKRMLAMWDILYDELKGESEANVLDALKKIGRSDKTINYFNIMTFIDESKPVAGTYVPSPPLPPPTKEEELAIKAMLAKLHKKMRMNR